MPYESGWAHHRNAKTTRGERASEWVQDQIDKGGPAKRDAAKSRGIRGAAEGMPSAPGGTTRRGLTAKEKRAADKILRKGKKG
jgi:hypothetical protein